MGFQINGPERLPSNGQSDSSVKTGVELGGLPLLSIVIRRKPGESPSGFELNWTTKKNNFYLIAAITDSYLACKSTYEMPIDPETQKIAKQIRSSALSIANRSAQKGIIPLEVADNLRFRREAIEAFQLTISNKPGVKDSHFHYVQDNQSPAPNTLKEELLARIPPSEMMSLSIISPFFVAEFDGLEGAEKRVSLSSRYRLLGQSLELLAQTAVLDIDTEQRVWLMNQLSVQVNDLKTPPLKVTATAS